MSQEKLGTGEIIGITAGVTASFAVCCWWWIRKRLGMSKAKTKGSSDLELATTSSDPSDSTLASTPRSQLPNPGVSTSSVSHPSPHTELSTTVGIISSESFSVFSQVIRPEHGSLSGSPRASNSDQQHNLPYVPLALRNSSPYRGPLGSPRISGEETQGTDGSPRFSGTPHSLPASPRNSGPHSASPSPRISADGREQYNPSLLPQSVSFHKGSSSPRTSGELQKIEESPRASSSVGYHGSPKSSPQGTPKTSTTPKVRFYSVSNAASGVEFQYSPKGSPGRGESYPSGRELELQLQSPNEFEEEVKRLKEAVATQGQQLEEAKHRPLGSVASKSSSLGQGIHELEVKARMLDDYMNGEKKNSQELPTTQELDVRIEELDGFKRRLAVLVNRVKTFDTYAAAAKKEKGKKTLETSHSSPSLGYTDNQSRL